MQNSRRLIRKFLDTLSDDHRESSHDMEVSNDGTISPEELYQHFDLNNDGRVTPNEYVDHIEYHAAYPETLDHYKQLRGQSYEKVPCRSSYDKSSEFLLSNPQEIDVCIKPLMDKMGSDCRESSLRCMIDIIQSMIKCGII